MTLTFSLLSVAHWAALAAIVVGYTLAAGRGAINQIMVWGARVQLLVGLALVAVAEMGHLTPPLNHAWVGVKLVVALAVVGCCEASRSRAAKGSDGAVLMHVAAGLVVVNVLVATLWR